MTKDEFVGGRISQITYSGMWSSDDETQGDYLSSQNGDFLGAATMVSEKKVRCIFQIHETKYIDSPLLEAYGDADLESPEQSTFSFVVQKEILYKHSLFSSKRNDTCTLEFTFNFINKSDKTPLPISSNDLKNAGLTGSVTSADCKLNFTFGSEPTGTQLVQTLVFLVIEVAAIFVGLFPLYRILKTRNLNRILVVNEWVQLANIMIDITILVVNLQFSLRIMVEYFEFLTVITILLLFSVVFKMRFLVYTQNMRITRQNLQPQLATRKKFLELLKFMFAGLVCIFCANLVIAYEFIFYIFFAYPLLQVIFNFSEVTQRNCFLFDLHLPLILPQLLYPLYMKSFSFSFFRLTPVFSFPIILVGEVLFLLLLLFLQKTFGACFFIPKTCIPNYFNYFKKFSPKVAADENCPICFSSLREFSDDIEESGPVDSKTKRPLIPKTFMETPCGHRFHESCLKNWMEQKLVCPCCRKNIPPVI